MPNLDRRVDVWSNPFNVGRGLLEAMRKVKQAARGGAGAGRKAAFVGVILLCAVSAFAQFARKRSSGPAYVAAEEEVHWETFLVPGAAEPTLRFPVGHQHGASACLGGLFVTRSEIRYVVKTPLANRDHGFSYPRQSLREARQWRFMRTEMPEVEYKFSGGGTYHFFRIRESMFANPSQKFDWNNDMLSWQPLAWAALEFDQVVATAQQRLAALKPREVPPPSAPPKMRIMEPAIADPTQPVEVSQAMVTLRGAALDSRGVLSVMVGDRQAELRSTGDIRAVEFTGKDIPLREGLNRVAVTATNVDHQTAQMEVLFWYRPPAPPPPPPAVTTPIVPTPPSPPTPIETETMTPAAPSTPTAAPAAPATPKMGPSDTVPLSMDEILQMVKNSLPSDQIADLVKESGIDFEPTDGYLETLRRAGAKEILIEAIRQAKRVKQ